MSINACRSALAGAALILSSAVAAVADVPKVAVDIAPVQSLVARVMQGLGAPEQIVRQGASPHGYALRPSEARNLTEADAVFWIGPALEPWLERSIDTLAPDAVVVRLLDVPGTTVLEFRQGAQFVAHEDEGHDDDHEGHDHSGSDPHGWLDPENGKLWLNSVADELAKLDPDNADVYAANASAGKSEIDAAAAQIRQDLAPIANLRFVVFHDAYQYFEARFDLAALGAISAGDASDPGPARIEAVRGIIRDGRVDCVFSEPEFNQSFVETVIEGTEVKAAIIDPLGSQIAPGPEFYPALLRAVSDELVGCAK
ncbi:zinc ABC transporter substrate-binding protein [Roseovarius arcticus]|uniref:zinc ABC transporter substrate-binding protein n=1 Tax=Roseovarius arcticus TaxID=2547404 RepID=UPI0011107429|nr:zinc ABC transporter substrate-binding protein [Roseovarius arcticus]